MQTLSTARSGTTCSSFEVVREEKLDDYQGTGTLYRHKKTGMEVFHIKNEDKELFCGFIFRTLPTSSNGVAHILEHTVLSGSKRFSLKDPFMAVSSGSANTFMNALTYPGCTFYPFASVLKKDFDNIFEVYSDAVFSPLLRRETFLMEGIRQEGSHFDGVVFNEMKGNYSDQESLLSAYSQMGLFEGTPYGFDSGGKVDEIPNLTYEEYMDCYRRWYAPDNCKLFLYGDLDPQEYMQYLEENYLAGRTPVLDNPLPATDVIKTSPFQLEVAGPDSADSSVVVCWSTFPESDGLQLITLSVLVEILLGDPGNPLYRAISESDLGEDLSEESGMGVGFRFMPFVVGFSGAKRENARAIEDFILKTLSEICERGLDPKLVEAAIKAEEFSLQEVQRNYYPIGYFASQRAMRGWLDGKGPFDSVKTARKVRQLREAIAADPQYFEHWIKENLLENPRRMLLTVYPDKDYETKLKEKIKTHLRPEYELETFASAQKAMLEAFNQKKDSEEDLRRVGHLQREDLDGGLLRFDYSEREIAGQKAYVQNMFTNGICYFTLSFDTRDLSLEEHLLLPLMLRVLWMTGLGDLDYSQVAIRLKELTGSSMMVPTCAMTLENLPVSSATAIVKTLRRDCVSALSFIADLLCHGDLSSSGRVKAALVDFKSDFKSNFIEVAHSFALRRATAGFSPSMMEQEYVTGLSQWEFLEKASHWPIKKLKEELSALRAKVMVRSRLMSQIGCDEDSNGVCVQAVEAFSAVLDQGSGEIRLNEEFYGLTSNFQSELETFSIPGQVAYNALALKLDQQSEKERMAKLLLSSILNDHGLWERVRSRGGAYMAETRQGMYNDFFYFSSYRDPRINGTFEDFMLSLQEVAEKGVDEKDLETQIISLVGRELRPRSPMDLCAEGRKRFVLGLSEEIYRSRIQTILQLKPQDVADQAKILLQKLSAGSSKVVIAPRSLMKRNSIDVTETKHLSL